MTKIKSLLAFTAAILCGGAWAALSPVAVWDGDFSQTEKVDGDGRSYKINLNGQATVSADGTYLQMNSDATSGVQISFSSGITSANGLTVVVNFVGVTAQDCFALGFKKSGTNTDLCGCGLVSDKRTRLYQSGYGYYTAPNGEASKISSFDDFEYCASYKSSSGTTAWKCKSEAWTSQQNTAIKESNASIDGVSIGGTWTTSSAGATASLTGAKIKSIVILKDGVSEASDLVAYKASSSNDAEYFTTIASDTAFADLVWKNASDATVSLPATVDASVKMAIRGTGTVSFSGTFGGSVYLEKGIELVPTAGVAATAKLTGYGTITYPTTALPGDEKSCYTAATWSGTVALNYTTKHQFAFSGYGNARSVLRLTGVNGYAPNDDNASFGGTIELKDNGNTKAWTINDAYEKRYTVGKLIGDGTFTVGGTQSSQAKYLILDASEFNGEFHTGGNNKSVTIGGERSNTSGLAANGNIVVRAGGIANVASGKTWAAKNNGSITINGTVKGVGTLGSNTIFGDGATIDITGNTESAALTMAQGKTVTFNGALNLAGTIESGSVVLKGLSIEPELSFMTVSVNGALVPGAHLYYENGALKYSNQVSSFWTPNPNSSCVDANGIFDWTAPHAWKDTTGADATWSVAADAETKPDVYIDATRIKGVKIAGQIYVGKVTVAGALGAEESFQFYSRIYDPDHIDEAVDGEHEVDDTIDCLHATSVNLTGLMGTLGMKVPITGDIAFGKNTHLVFATGTDEKTSTAYGYTFLDRGGSIAVEGSGKFVVPSSMYTISFAPASGAKLVYTSNTNATVSGTISGAGAVIKEGTGILTFSGTNSFTGGTTIENGTIKLGTQKGLGEQGSAVTVNGTGVLDVNGTQNHGIVLTLAGGTVKNTGSGVSTGNVQFRSISLTADSTIDIAASTGVVNNSYGATTVQLNNHKLVKNGTGVFLLAAVTISNGTIEIGAGSIKVEQATCTLNNVKFTVPSTAAANMVVQNAALTTAPVNTVFQQTERAGGEEIILVSSGATPTYKLETGNGATIKDGDVIVINGSKWQANRWMLSNLPTGHAIKITAETDIDSIPANVELTINYKDYPQSGNKKGVYLRGNIGANATIDGVGALFLGFTANSTIADGVVISCDVGFQSSTYHQIIAENATVTFEGDYIHVAGASIKLNSGSKLIVKEKLPQGAVESNVEGKIVDFDPETKSYSLIDPIETAQTWTMGDVIFDGDFHGVAWGANGVGTKTVNGVEYTINLNGHEIVKDGDKSYILIKGPNEGNNTTLGVKVSRSDTNGTGATVVMRYSDIPAFDESKYQVMMTIDGSKFDNISSIHLADENGNMKNGWANYYNGVRANADDSVALDSLGETLMLSYGTGGTFACQKNGEGEWIQLVKDTGGIGGDTYNIGGFALGGMFTANNSAQVAAGLKIHSVAVAYAPTTTKTDSKITKPIFSGDDLVYSAFLTKTPVDTGLIVDSLEDLLDFNYYGTMDGGNIRGNDVLSRGFHVTKDEANNCVTFQMQVRQNQGTNDDHVKAVKIKLTLNANKHVLIEGVEAGHISNQYLGTSITSWTDTLVTNASTAGYGVNKVIATKKPMPFVSVGFDGDTWTSSMVAKDYASGRVTGNFMEEHGTAELSNFETVRESATDKAVKISSDIRPSYKDDANITFAKAVKNAESWTVQVVAKMTSQTGKRLALWGIGDTSYQGSANEERGVALLLGTDGLPKFVKYGQRTTTDIAVCTEGESLCDRRYHVYTVVCDKDAVADKYVVYVDGEKVAASGDAALTAIPTSNQYFEIGTVRGGANELHNSQTTPTAIAIGSYFDDAAAWNVALSAKEVKINANKFPVWPNYSPADWQGEDGADIGTGANWGIDSDFNPAMTQGVFPTTSSIKEVSVSSDTTFGALEINGEYKFTGSGVVTVNLLSFGANGSLRLETGVTLNFVSGLNPSYLANITFAGGQITAKEVPHFTQAENLTIDPTVYTAQGGHKLISWTDFMKTGEDGYGMPTLNTNALNPAAVLANHENTISELDWGNGSKSRLLGLVGEIFLEVRSAEQLARKPIRILPLGDSITEGFNGSGNCANYRTQLAAKLSMAGYNVEMLGYHFVRSFMPSGEWAPIEWQYHAGVSAQRVWTRTQTGGENERAGDMEAIEATLNMCGGTPDIVLVKLGTNDIGNWDSADHIYDGLTNILDKVHSKFTNAKVIVTTAINYKTNNDGRKAYNKKIRDAFAAGGDLTGSNYSWLYFVDQCKKVGDGSEAGSFNDAQGRLIFYTDGTHPDWAGHDLMSDGWYEKIVELVKVGDGKDVPAKTACKLGAKANVPAEYLEGFTRYRQLDIAEEAAYAQSEFTGYTWSSEKTVTDITKVGYFMELVRKDTGSHKYVWVDMDNFGDNTVQSFGLPTTATHQQVVNKLHVYSNMESIHNVAANDDTVKGYIEFSPYNYTATAKTGAGIPEALWRDMDWNDTFVTSGAGRGSMQVHRVKKDGDALWNGGEVLFAYNNWGSANTINGAKAAEIGIGNFAQHYVGDYSRNGNKDIVNACHPGTGVNIDSNWISVDYTGTRVSPVCDRVNAKAYEVMRLEIWVKGTVSGESPSEEETVVITTIPEAGVEIKPDDDVKVTIPQDSTATAVAAKISVKYTDANGTTTDLKTRGYVTVAVADNGAVTVAPTEAAKPDAVKIKMTLPKEGEGEGAKDKVSFTITDPIPGLFYSIVSANGPTDSDFAAQTAVDSTGTQATGSESTTTSIDMPTDAKVKYFRVRVKATK